METLIVQSEIARLETLIPFIPEHNIFGESNWDKIREQQRALEYPTDHVSEFDYQEEVQDARDWLNGDTQHRPSSTWDELAGIKRLDTANLEVILNKPSVQWFENKHDILKQLQESEQTFTVDLENLLFVAKEGIIRFGHWQGPLADNCACNRTLIRHVWIELSGKVLDPTRWVFEGVDPYIYIGPNDYYDVGGQQTRLIRGVNLPQPEGIQNILVPDTIRNELHTITTTKLALNQLFYLANLPPVFHPSIPKVYDWIEELGYAAFIPLDFRDIVSNQ